MVHTLKVGDLTYVLIPKEGLGVTKNIGRMRTAVVFLRQIRRAAVAATAPGERGSMNELLRSCIMSSDDNADSLVEEELGASSTRIISRYYQA